MSAHRIRKPKKAALKLTSLCISAALVVLLLATPSHGQHQIILDASYRHVLHSKINGTEYQLTVVLPEDYETSRNARYPVFYVMDGNRWAKALAVLLPRFVKSAGYPPFIVVGVDYPGKTGRYQDYGPVSQRYFPVSENRGYVNFMHVLKKEIIPLVDSAYRTDPTDRGIGGHSMGGLFAAYALLNESDTFGRFWISSPSLFYDNEILFQDFETFRRKAIKRSLHVFTDIGGEEVPSMRNVLARFGQRLLEVQPGKVMLRSLTVPGATHATVVPSVFAPAFEHLYMSRPSIISVPADLVRFAGRYRAPDGSVFTFVTDGDVLMYRDMMIEYEQGSLSRLSASAPNRFYHREASREFLFAAEGEASASVRITEGGTVRTAVRLADIAPSTKYQVKVGTP